MYLNMYVTRNSPLAHNLVATLFTPFVLLYCSDQNILDSFSLKKNLYCDQYEKSDKPIEKGGFIFGGFLMTGGCLCLMKNKVDVAARYEEDGSKQVRPRVSKEDSIVCNK